MILHRNRLAAVLMLFLPTLFYLSLNQWWLNNHTSTNVDVKQALVSLLTEETVMVREVKAILLPSISCHYGYGGRKKA